MSPVATATPGAVCSVVTCSVLMIVLISFGQVETRSHDCYVDCRTSPVGGPECPEEMGLDWALL